MWAGSYRTYRAPIVSRDGAVSYLNAEAGGIFLPEAEHGQPIAAGQTIGIIADTLTGEVAQQIKAPTSGLLFTLREYPVVYPGSLVARILEDQQ